MAFFGVRVRVRQDFDIITSAATQAEAEAIASKFRTVQDENILGVSKFGSEVSTVQGSSALNDPDSIYSKQNAKNFVSNIIEDLSAVVTDPAVIITAQEYTDLKTKLLDLRTYLNSIK